MNAHRVAVATITWARTADEELSLRRALPCLCEAGLPVVVADKGSNASFTAFVRALPRVLVVEPSVATLVGQTTAAIAAALRVGTPYVLYTEPDKEAFFAQHLRAFLERAPEGPDVGAVLASRSEASFRSFPPTQQYTEGVANHLCAEAIGTPGDYMYGPFLMSRTVAEETSRIHSDVGWGWRPYTFRAAHRCGLRVVHVHDHYCCPPDQRDENEDDRVHRLRQLRDNILGLIV